MTDKPVYQSLCLIEDVLPGDYILYDEQVMMVWGVGIQLNGVCTLQLLDPRRFVPGSPQQLGISFEAEMGTFVILVHEDVDSDELLDDSEDQYEDYHHE